MIESIWECTVITHNDELSDLPNGADYQPRKAAVEAIEQLGLSVHSVSSGWGSEIFTPKIAALKRRVAILENECVEKGRKIERLESERESHLECLADISSACIGQLTMNYRLCAEDIGQQIYVATGKTNSELSAIVKSLRESK